MKNVLMIVGSLRKRSFNRQLAGEVEALMAGRASVSYLDWTDLPLLNQDIESPVPEAVARVRAEVQGSDGVWICSPEYNFNIPGSEKNLLDWLSRPQDPTNPTSPSAAKGKIVAISGAGGRAATAGVRGKLNELLGFMGMEVIGETGFGVALTPEAWGDDVLSLTDEQRVELGKLVDAFLGAIEE